MKDSMKKRGKFFERVCSGHKRLSSRYKELDSILTIVGVMVVGTTVMTLCNKGTDTKAEVKTSLVNNKAEEYFYNGEYTKAKDEYKRLEQGQDWPYYEAKLAEVYTVLGDKKKSNELIDEVVKKRMSIITQNGRDMYKDGDGELGTLVAYISFINDNPRAIEYAQSFYDDNSDDFNLNIMLFTLYLSNDQKDKALDILDLLSESDERSSFELANIAKMYIAVEENEKGLDILKKAWEKDQNDLKVYDTVLEITNSSINNLLSDIEERSLEDPDEECYKVWLLKYYSENPMASSKFEYYKNILSSNSDSECYMKDLIKYDFFDNENNQYTDKIINRIQKKEEKTYSEYNILSTYYQNAGDYNKALDCAEKSVGLNPYYDENYINNIPFNLKKKDQNARVEPFYRQAVYSEAYNCDSIIELADYYKNKLYNYDKAYEFYALAHKIEPENPKIIYNMAITSIENKKTDDAISLLEKCIELDPDNDNYYRSLSKIYYDQGEKDKVIGEIRKAYKLNKSDIRTLNNAGCYYIVYGKDYNRGLYNLKCAYEMIQASDDIEKKRIITQNYEAAKQLKSNHTDSVQNESETMDSLINNPLMFELFY